MKVSVVIATYNGEDFVTQQLESIRSQNRKPDEVLICDDRSTDNTQKLVSNFIERNSLDNWSFMINSENQGYQKNFYNLLKKASGDIIFLSDQDDEWTSDKIEKMTQIMQHDNSIETLNSGIQLIDQNSDKVALPARKNFYNANFLYSKEPLQYLNSFSLDDIIKRNISPGCSMCISKNLRDEFVSTYNFELPHDWFLNMIASVDKKCFFLNENLTRYRMHNNNTLGVSEDWGVQSKVNSFENSRQAKIKEFEQLLSSLTIISQRQDIKSADHLANYLLARLRFYKKQTLGSLLRLRDYKEYYQTATFRGQIWDFIVAFKLKKIIYRLIQM